MSVNGQLSLVVNKVAIASLGQIQTFEKEGTASCRCVIIVDVGAAGICSVIVCEALGHVKHANTRGSRGMPPRKF